MQFMRPLAHTGQAVMPRFAALFNNFGRQANTIIRETDLEIFGLHNINHNS